MLTEYVVHLAFLLLQYRLQAFLWFCLVFLLLGIARWFPNRGEMSFAQFVGRVLARAWAVFRRASLASTAVVASALLFVAGVLEIWVLPFVASLAVWGVWKKWKATSPARQPDSGPASSLVDPNQPTSSLLPEQRQARRGNC